MKLTNALLKRLIAEEKERMMNELEGTSSSDAVDTQASASSLTDQQKKKLKSFTASPPTNLSGFSTAMKTLGTILGEIDEKSANLNSGQIKMYFTQIMEIVDGMMSEKKTTSSETSKISKVVGV